MFNDQHQMFEKIEENKFMKNRSFDINVEYHTKVSVIVPIYNAEKYLKRCIDSILNQTFKDFEVILINDGSTDSSLEICNIYVASDNRIHVINQQNRGVSVARNNGIVYSKGEYITFVDSDDFLEPDALNVMYCAIRNGYDLVCASYRRVSNSRKNMASFIFEQKSVNVFQLAELCYDINLDISLGGPCWKLYKTSIIKINNIFFPEDMSYFEDNVFNIQYYSYIRKAYLLDTIVYNYYYTDVSLTANVTEKTFIDLINTHKKRKKYFSHFVARSSSENLANQFLVHFMVCIRLMHKKQGNIPILNVIKKMLSTHDVQMYIYDAFPECTLKYMDNISIIILKSQSLLLIRIYLSLINNITSNKILRKIFNR